jgi:hypothetical protein
VPRLRGYRSSWVTPGGITEPNASDLIDAEMRETAVRLAIVKKILSGT